MLLPCSYTVLHRGQELASSLLSSKFPVVPAMGRRERQLQPDSGARIHHHRAFAGLETRRVQDHLSLIYTSSWPVATAAGLGISKEILTENVPDWDPCCVLCEILLYGQEGFCQRDPCSKCRLQKP